MYLVKEYNKDGSFIGSTEYAVLENAIQCAIRARLCDSTWKIVLSEVEHNENDQFEETQIGEFCIYSKKILS